MYTLKIDLPYNLKNAQEIPQETTINLITIGLDSKYPQGLDGASRRVFGRLQRKFDEAVEKKEETIQLESAELDLIKNALSEGKYPVNFTKYVLTLEEEVERCEKEEV